MSRRRTRHRPFGLAALGAALVAGTFALAVSSPGEPTSRRRWQDDPLWNDGKAEVSVFEATETKYGTPRDFTAYFVVVAEDLRRDTLVKSEGPRPPAGLIRVLKSNQIYDIRTGLYSYRQMASVFLRISDLAPVKETVTSHEWCGNTFIHLVNRDGKATVRGFSYFDGEGETTAPLNLAEATVYDALPLALRAFPFRPGASRKIRLGSQLLGNHVRPVKVSDALITVTGAENVSTGMGGSEAWRLEVRHADGTDRFWFEKASPNRLVRWEQFDGGRYLLKTARRLAYWTLHGEGDEKALLDK